MSVKNKKQFGVWMNSHQAIIVGREPADTGDFAILAHTKTANNSRSNSNENSANNSEQGIQQKLFKEITSYMQNVDEIHVTGTGNAQEQFINYLSQIPQYKNTVAKESTSNKMGDEKFIEYIGAQFN
jgi:stalled ribosome rescue protein Dom34